MFRHKPPCAKAKAKAQAGMYVKVGCNKMWGKKSFWASLKIILTRIVSQECDSSLVGSRVGHKTCLYLYTSILAVSRQSVSRHIFFNYQSVNIYGYIRWILLNMRSFVFNIKFTSFKQIICCPVQMQNANAYFVTFRWIHEKKTYTCTCSNHSNS